MNIFAVPLRPENVTPEHRNSHYGNSHLFPQALSVVMAPMMWTAVISLLLAWYFAQIMGGSGRPRPFYFPCMPRYEHALISITSTKQPIYTLKPQNTVFTPLNNLLTPSLGIGATSVFLTASTPPDAPGRRNRKTTTYVPTIGFLFIYLCIMLIIYVNIICYMVS